MNQRQRALLEQLHRAGVRLRIEGDDLIYRAPRGVLTAEWRAALAEWKPDLLYEYHERAGILEYDAKLPRAEAEARAAQMLVPLPALSGARNCEKIDEYQGQAQALCIENRQ